MRGHIAAVREYLRGSLWFLPAISVVGALTLALLLVRVELEVETGTVLDEVVFGGGAEGARALLVMVAGSVITITSLVFTLTVVALQLAASNYSPRVLRNFLRDRGTQTTLSVFLATFAYSYMVLRTVRTETSEQDSFVPELAVTVLLLFVLASIAALVYFIHHITQSMRVDTILQAVKQDTLDTIDRVYPEDAEEVEGSDPVPDRARPVPATGSGIIQAVEPEALVRRAAELDVVVRFVPSVGDHVIAGTTLASVWAHEQSREAELADDLVDAVNGALQLGAERTMQEDVAFGIRQLVDIALRGLSTGLNDPTTANHSLAHIGQLLATLATRNLDPRVQRDEQGITRVVVPRPGFDDYLTLACEQVRVYGSQDPSVMGRLDRMLEDLEQLTDDPQRQEAIAAQRAQRPD